MFSLRQRRVTQRDTWRRGGHGGSARATGPQGWADPRPAPHGVGAPGTPEPGLQAGGAADAELPGAGRLHIRHMLRCHVRRGPGPEPAPQRGPAGPSSTPSAGVPIRACPGASSRAARGHHTGERPGCRLMSPLAVLPVASACRSQGGDRGLGSNQGGPGPTRGQCGVTWGRRSNIQERW